MKILIVAMSGLCAQNKNTILDSVAKTIGRAYVIA